MTGHDRDTVTLLAEQLAALSRRVDALTRAVTGLVFLALAVVILALASCGAGPEAPATPNPGYVGTPTPTPRNLPTSEAIAWPNHLSSPGNHPSSPGNHPSSPAVIDIVSSHRVSGVQYTRAEMVAILDAVDWPHETREAALQVAWCESRWRSDATGAAGEMSLWQIHPRWHADATYDPVGNARAALRISDGGRNWSAWSCRP